MSQSIIPTITWVNETPSASGKTVKVYLSHPTFAEGVTHFGYIPVELSPRKWDRVTANTVKVGDIEVDYLDTEKNIRVALKTPRVQVSFFGTPSIEDPEVQDNTWSDNRTTKVDDTQSF